MHHPLIAYKLHISTAAIGCHRQTWPKYMSMSQNWVTRPNPMLYHRFPKFHYNPTDWRYKPRDHALLFVYSFVSPFNSKFIFQYILHYIPYFPHSIPIHNVYATSVLLLNLYTSIIFESPKTADPNSRGILRTIVRLHQHSDGFGWSKAFKAQLGRWGFLGGWFCWTFLHPLCDSQSPAKRCWR